MATTAQGYTAANVGLLKALLSLDFPKLII